MASVARNNQQQWCGGYLGEREEEMFEVYSVNGLDHGFNDEYEPDGRRSTGTEENEDDIIIPTYQPDHHSNRELHESPTAHPLGEYEFGESPTSPLRNPPANHNLIDYAFAGIIPDDSQVSQDMLQELACSIHNGEISDGYETEPEPRPKRRVGKRFEYKSFTIEEKLEFIKCFKDAGGRNVRVFAAANDINEQTFYNWVHRYDRGRFLNSPNPTRKRIRESRYPAVEAELLRYMESRQDSYKTERGAEKSLSWVTLQTKAAEIAQDVLSPEQCMQFKSSSGWIRNLLRRNNLQKNQNSSDSASSTPMSHATRSSDVTAGTVRDATKSERGTSADRARTFDRMRLRSRIIVQPKTENSDSHDSELDTAMSVVRRSPAVSTVREEIKQERGATAIREKDHKRTHEQTRERILPRSRNPVPHEMEISDSLDSAVDTPMPSTSPVVADSAVLDDVKKEGGIKSIREVARERAHDRRVRQRARQEEALRERVLDPVVQGRAPVPLKPERTACPERFMNSIVATAGWAIKYEYDIV
jgi:transposase-like protein